MNMYKNKHNETVAHVSKTFQTHNNTLISTIKVVLGVFALFAAAQIVIPIKPVPITLQTIVISLIGLTYTPCLSFVTLLIYLSLGMIGLPMFTTLGSGINHFSGVTGGYLLGFLIAAPTIAYLKNFFNSKFFSVMACCLIGHIVIYILGIIWLSTFIRFEQAIYSGFLIYIPTGVFKITIFSYLFSYIKQDKN